MMLHTKSVPEARPTPFGTLLRHSILLHLLLELIHSVILPLDPDTSSSHLLVEGRGTAMTMGFLRESRKIFDKIL